jgi:hypothetical protein
VAARRSVLALNWPLSVCSPAVMTNGTGPLPLTTVMSSSAAASRTTVALIDLAVSMTALRG